MKWTRVTQTENIPTRQGRSVRIGDVDVAIFNLVDRFLAVENRCPHQGGPLCDGIVSGTTVVCPLHGWRFDLETGVAVRASSPACLTIFPTRVEDGIVMIDIGAGSRIDTHLESGEVAA
jgi:nitrite reductase (NADH) small subunit